MKIEYLFGGFGRVASVDTEAFLCDNFGMYVLRRRGITWLAASINFTSWAYLKENLWVRKDNGEVASLGGKKAELNCQHLARYAGSVDDWTVGVVTLSWKESDLVSVNTHTKERFIVEGSYNGATVGAGFIFAKEGKELCAFNVRLEEKWRAGVYEGRRSSLSGVGCLNEIYPFEKLVICNAGIDIKSKEGRVVALSVLDGSEIWSYEYSREINYAFLKEDKYYIAEDGCVVVLDARTGIVARKADLNLGVEFVFEPFGKKIIIGSHSEKKLYLYDMVDCLLTAVAKLPEGFNFSMSSFRNVTADTLRFELKADHPTLKYCTGGILTIPLDKGLAGLPSAIEVEERLTMPMMLTEDAKGERAYLFTVSCDNLNDLRRLAAIEISEFAYAYGEPVARPIMNPDKKHKGKVKVVVDADVLPKGSEAALVEWARDLTTCLDQLAVFPGAGDQYRFDIQVEMRKS